MESNLSVLQILASHRSNLVNQLALMLFLAPYCYHRWVGDLQDHLELKEPVGCEVKRLCKPKEVLMPFFFFFLLYLQSLKAVKTTITQMTESQHRH